MTKKDLQHLQLLQKRKLRSKIKTEARSRLGFGLFFFTIMRKSPDCRDFGCCLQSRKESAVVYGDFVREILREYSACWGRINYGENSI